MILCIINRKLSTIGVNVPRKVMQVSGFSTSVRLYMLKVESQLMKQHNFKSLIPA